MIKTIYKVRFEHRLGPDYCLNWMQKNKFDWISIEHDWDYAYFVVSLYNNKKIMVNNVDNGIAFLLI